MKMPISSAIFATLALVGCAHETRSGSTQVTGGWYESSTSNDEAVMQLTNARCDRELACNNIGLERRFTDRNACAREIGRGIHSDLRPEVCPRGVDRTKLSLCVAVARQERCGNILDSIDRATSCRRSELCL